MPKSKKTIQDMQRELVKMQTSVTVLNKDIRAKKLQMKKEEKRLAAAERVQRADAIAEREAVEVKVERQRLREADRTLAEGV